MVTTYVYRNGELVPKPARECRATLQTISDWGPTQSPIDAKVYDGRRAYLDHLRAHGCEITGNDLRPAQMGGPGGYTGDR